MTDEGEMARVDSGNETLLSDESPCDLPTTPTASSAIENTSSIPSNNCSNEENSVPPKITPFSGVLDKV